MRCSFSCITAISFLKKINCLIIQDIMMLRKVFSCTTEILQLVGRVNDAFRLYYSHLEILLYFLAAIFVGALVNSLQAICQHCFSGSAFLHFLIQFMIFGIASFSAMCCYSNFIAHCCWLWRVVLYSVS